MKRFEFKILTTLSGPVAASRQTTSHCLFIIMKVTREKCCQKAKSLELGIYFQHWTRKSFFPWPTLPRRKRLKSLQSMVYSFMDYQISSNEINIIFISEAVTAIILHSESANWLLNRKKLTRAMLFGYLNLKKVPISGQAEKSTIITRILELWAVAEPQNVIVSATEEPSSFGENQSAHAITHSSADVNSEMGLKFSQWFYEILLAVHKQTVPGSKLSEQFWRDVRFKITLNACDNTNCQEAIGSDEVNLHHWSLSCIFNMISCKQAANLLQILLCQHGFLLNPNLSSNGVRERKDPHGMVIIGVCGTAHQFENCSGIFEQVFGLLQDPSVEFHWRIKWSELRITQATVNRLPCLTDLPELQAICDNSMSWFCRIKETWNKENLPKFNCIYNYCNYSSSVINS